MSNIEKKKRYVTLEWPLIVMKCVCFLCYSPELFNYEDLLDNDSHTNLEHAFSRAHEKLGIDRLLDPEGYSHYTLLPHHFPLLCGVVVSYKMLLFNLVLRILP